VSSYVNSPVNLRIVTWEKEASIINEHSFVIKEGDKANVDIENSGDQGYYFSLLDLQPDNEINLLFPSSSKGMLPENCYIKPHSRHTYTQYIITIFPPYGIDKLILIASKSPDVGKEIDQMFTSGNSGRGLSLLNLNSQLLLNEIEWILQGEPSRVFKDCFFSVMDMVIIPGEGVKTKRAFNGSGGNSSGLNSFLSTKESRIFKPPVEERCIDKIKDPENLYLKYPLISFSQPVQAGATRGTIDVHPVDTRSFVIKGTASASKGIKKIMVNGKEGNIKELSPQQYSWQMQADLEEGENKFVITCTTREGIDICDELILSYKKESLINEPRNYSLFIGINKYQHWDMLEGAQYDAQCIRKLLKDSFDFSDQYSIELYDDAATYNKIESVFRKLITDLHSNDNLLVYFAGHGALDNQLDEGYLIPVEARKCDKDNCDSCGCTRDYINYSELKKYIEKLKAKHIVVFADACYSGTFFQYTTPKISERSMTDEDELRSKWLFCSGRKHVVADKMWGEKNSPFAYYLMKFLKEAPEEGLKVGKLYEELKVNVKKEEDGDQTPIAGPINLTGDEGGQFVFKKKKSVKQ
jgi:hypothetical protein